MIVLVLHMQTLQNTDVYAYNANASQSYEGNKTCYGKPTLAKIMATTVL